MKAKYKGPKLREISLCWILHFGFHLIAAAVALAAGLFIIFGEGAILPGLVLCGTAIFAFINGVNGFRELIGTKKRGGYLRDN